MRKCRIPTVFKLRKTCVCSGQLQLRQLQLPLNLPLPLLLNLPLSRHSEHSEESHSRASRPFINRCTRLLRLFVVILCLSRLDARCRPACPDKGRDRGPAFGPTRDLFDFTAAENFYSAAVHPSTGLNSLIAAAAVALLAPRSCWYTTPSLSTINVIIPVLR